MLKMFSRAMLALLLAAGAALPARAQDIQPSAAFEQRAQELASIINGAGDPDDYFAPSFLAQVPAAQFRILSTQITAQQGQAGAASAYRMTTPNQGQFDLAFANAIGDIRMTVSEEGDHKVVGLLITGFRTENDSMEAVKADFEALSGKAP